MVMTNRARVCVLVPTFDGRLLDGICSLKSARLSSVQILSRWSALPLNAPYSANVLSSKLMSLICLSWESALTYFVNFYSIWRLQATFFIFGTQFIVSYINYHRFLNNVSSTNLWCLKRVFHCITIYNHRHMMLDRDRLWAMVTELSRLRLHGKCTQPKHI